jgi:hypothetical protein
VPRACTVRTHPESLGMPESTGPLASLGSSDVDQRVNSRLKVRSPTGAATLRAPGMSVGPGPLEGDVPPLKVAHKVLCGSWRGVRPAQVLMR